MRANESPELAKVRWDQLALVQEHYADFIDFLRDGMEMLGFSATEIQESIADFLVNGPQYLMIQAQRGQAKTTVAALFAVWVLIHNPSERVLIVSAGGTQAEEISTLIVRTIMQHEMLECMRPDKLAGDKTAVDGFDVHHSLKGLDKSPSVGCFGIDSNIQGKRAGLLIADDVESGKNSATAVQRAKLLHITKDFTSINSTGRIVWLGTPQSMDSIYNSLPGRGVEVRIWPGRYPTPEQRKTYGDMLASLIATRLDLDPSLGEGGGLLGDQGQPVDPVILGETTLQKKERDQGTPYFQLQHMLSTAMTDALRFPIKLSSVVYIMGAIQQLAWPITVTRAMEAASLQSFAIESFGFTLMAPSAVSEERAPFSKLWAYIDPAAGGANADETAYAVGGFLNGNIVLLEVGGIPGGYELAKLEELATRLCRYKLDGLRIEKNMGHGAFRAVFQPILRAKQKELSLPQCAIEDDQVGSTQKELRIINVLTPIIGRGSLIVTNNAVEKDEEDILRYGAAQRLTYSLFFQLAKLTATRDSLVHDDRADALAGLCHIFSEDIALDQKKEVERLRAKAHAELIKDPLGYNRYKTPGQMRQSRTGSMLAHRGRFR